MHGLITHPTERIFGLMAKEIKVPVPDQTTEEVRIVKWIKGEGDTVAKGEVILEVETDKSVMEV